jgi:selenocysteine-specific elongation factor
MEPPMPSTLILGTAGHIDHGKTSLVRALTGIDTDRLPEEKARGITIDLGFARLDLGSITLGIVDVPGHERFIRNMLAGATGIRLALIAVAADDGIMPQTREHLEILANLRVPYAAVAITKSDLVDNETRAVVRLEIEELIGDGFREPPTIIETSTRTGQGIVDLKAELSRIAALIESETDLGFRMAIDRVFVRQGHGTIVTGSVTSGSLTVGDEIDWHHDGMAETVRIRGLASHGQSVERVQAGQRAAVNLAGVSHEQVRRGHELARPGFLASARMLTVRLTVSRNARPLKHRLPVRVHLGTAEVMGRVSLLEAAVMAPGESGWVQIDLDEPVTALWGQPCVIRDHSAEATLGGGTIVDPSPIRIRRSDRESLKMLSGLLNEDAGERARSVAWLAGLKGVASRDWPRLAAIATPPGAGVSLVGLPFDPDRLWHADQLAALEAKVLTALGRRHAANPLATNHDRAAMIDELAIRTRRELVDAVMTRLISSKQVIGDSKRIARADIKPRLNAAQQQVKTRIVAALSTAGVNPPELATFAVGLSGGIISLREICAVAEAEGLIVKIAADIYLHCEVVASVMATVNDRMPETGATVAMIRDWLQTTRKFAVPIAEYLDRAGLTVRRGDLRFLK